MPQIFERTIGLLEQGTLPVMLPLVFTCFCIGVLAIDRFCYFFDPRVLLSFLPPVRSRLQDDRREVARAFERYIGGGGPECRDQLVQACLRYRTPYTRFILRMLAGTGHPGGKIRVLEAECAELEENHAIEGGMSLLSAFARAAPLMGLMGTVTGMIATFGAMMTNATNDPKALSSGISIALTATNVGLVVSLPGVVCMGWLSRRGQALQSQIRIASMQLRNAPRSHS